MPLGIYLSVPFCRSKCSFCNFASGVASREKFDRYVERLIVDIEGCRNLVDSVGAGWESRVDSIYLGGGTPTVLDPFQLDSIFTAITSAFSVTPECEITIECAPGTLNAELLDLFNKRRVNRVSLGVQSFVDRECAAVGRLHNRNTVLDDISALRQAGITNLNVDLIVGLPHQTEESLQFSLDEVIQLQTPHVSVYMLEVDDDSRLGRELTAGGSRYHAHFVPDEERAVAFYESAGERLNAAGIRQYEISNYAKPGFESQHNLKYWTHQPYLGFGLDAHSMLRTANGGIVRFATPDEMSAFELRAPANPHAVPLEEEIEEEFFLGLRLNQGVNIDQLAQRFGSQALWPQFDALVDCENEGLVERLGPTIRLTRKGRLLSNEVFARMITTSSVT